LISVTGLINKKQLPPIDWMGLINNWGGPKFLVQAEQKNTFFPEAPQTWLLPPSWVAGLFLGWLGLGWGGGPLHATWRPFAPPTTR